MGFDWERDLLLPDLSEISFGLLNPGTEDFLIDVVQLAINKFLHRFERLNVSKVESCIVTYYRENYEKIAPEVRLSPSEVRRIISGLMQPKRFKNITSPLENRNFKGILKRYYNYWMTGLGEIRRRRHFVPHFHISIDFDFTNREFLLRNTRDTFQHIARWWWDEKKQKGFVTSKKGEEIVYKAGCFLRFLMYQRDEKSLEEFRKATYTEIAIRIGEAIDESKNGYITVLDVKYLVFANCPHLVDEFIVSNIVNCTNELCFLDPFTISFLNDNDDFESICQQSEETFYEFEHERTLSDSGYAQNSRGTGSTSNISYSSAFSRELDCGEKKGCVSRNQNLHLFDNIPG